MVGGSAPAEIIIVHAGKIVMDQAVSMDHFNGCRKGRGLLPVRTAHPAEIKGKNGTKPLAPCQKAVAHGIKQHFLWLSAETIDIGFQVLLNKFPVFPAAILKFHLRRPPLQDFRQERS